MKITIHHGHIDHKHGYDHFATADAAAFTAWLAAFCRTNWHRWFHDEDPDDTIPETNEEIVETYFDRSGDGCCGDGEYYFHEQTDIEIPA